VITAIRISNPETACVPWWSEVEQLKGLKSIKFDPGLNVLVGPNGSGKSTILMALARMLHCAQGDVQVVTQTSVIDICGPGLGSKIMKGVMPVHDGLPVMHFDPSKTVGLFGGSFDWDFGMEGIQNTMAKGSAGQTTLIRFDRVGAVLLGHKEPEGVEWKHTPYKDTTKNQIEKILAGKPIKGKKSRPTLLLDEPTRSLDMRYQMGVWVNIARAAQKRLQIIVAAHSPLALLIPGANIIEMEKGYAEAVKLNLDALINTERMIELINQEPQKPKKKAVKKPKKKAAKKK